MARGISDQRVLFSDNGTIVDGSFETIDYNAGTLLLNYVAADDKLYVGSFLPFNHKFIKMSVPNDVASALTVEVWNGKEWISVIDKFDRTAVAGVSLAQDGVIRWSLDREETWAREVDSFDVTGLSTTIIYNMYWARLSWSANLKVTTAISFIGHKFSNDQDLFGNYPSLNNATLLSRWQSGKTTWEQQEIVAADVIIQDLTRRSIIFTADQILEPEIFKEASIHKTAEIIFSAFGDAFKDDALKAKAAYETALDLKNFKTDMNQTGNIEMGERGITTGFMKR